MKRVTYLVFFFAFVFLAFDLFAQNASGAQDEIAQLKEFYNLRDFETGYNFGKKTVEKSPENLELQAWFILNFAHYEPDEAVIYSENLAERHKDQIWMDFANAYALIRVGKSKEALSLAEKILKVAPENEDFIFLKASALSELDKNDEGLNWLSKSSKDIKDKSKLLVFRAEFLYYKAKTEKDKKAEELAKESFENFAEARKINPLNVNAFFYSGFYLNREKRYAEAAQVLKTAIRLSPRSIPVRREFWKAILEGKSEAVSSEKKKQLNAAISEFLKINSNSPKTLYAVYTTYQNAGMNTEKAATENLLLKKFPFSSEAEKFLVNKIYNLAYDENNSKISARKNSQIIKMCLEFINRPKHFNLESLGRIYTNLFSFSKDDQSFTNRDFLKYAAKAATAKPSIGSDFYPNLVYGLLGRNLLTAAENYARLGVKATEEALKDRYDSIKDETVRDDFTEATRNNMLGALGKVLFKQKKYDEAEALLIKTESFQNLGEMYFEQGKYEKAEDAYISYLASAFKQDEAWKVIKDYYKKRNGSLIGYEEFEEKVKKLETVKRRDKIIAEKISQSKTVLPFSLKDIAGKPLNFEDVKGKIIVINFWGTWCQPCVVEMPEFQLLYKKYADDKDVAIITIAQDDLENVKKFMSEKKYEFSVLMGENYLSQVGVNIYPTTWFVDKSGKIVYVKIGNSPKLLEEFVWRIEALR